jgi:hypothetical protein
MVADDPPPALVERLAQAFTDGDTAIVPMLDVLFRSAEFWAAVGQKTRTPLERLVATMRVLGVQPGGNTADAMNTYYWAANEMGQRPLAWSAPNGYPDVHAAWRSVSGLLAGWNKQRALVEGWDQGFTYIPSPELVAGLPAGTVGEYVDSLSQRLTFQTLQPQHRDVLLGFVGAAAEAPATEGGLSERPGPLATVILNSPYFALR